MISILVRVSFMFILLSAFVIFVPSILGMPAHLPAEFGQAVQYFVNSARQFDWLLPINTLFAMFKFVMGIEIALLAFRIGRWLLHLFGSATAGNA